MMDFQDVLILRQVKKSWNISYGNDKYQDSTRVIGPFRAVTNRGDFLSRSSVDPQSRIEFSSANSKIVPDSSEYTNYRKQRAMHIKRKENVIYKCT
jgi:hypothetical protein